MIGPEASEGGDRLRSLHQICIADQATGFNWENGRWVRTQFKEETYVVSKVEPPKDLAEAQSSGRLLAFLACGSLRDEWPADDNHKIYSTCLMSHEMGRKNPNFMGCTEMHTKEVGTDTWVVTFACGDSNFYFERNGHFHLGTVHGSVRAKPEDDYKDSLVISVGRCAGLGGEALEGSSASESNIVED